MFVFLMGIALLIVVNYNPYQTGQMQRFYTEIAGRTYMLRHTITQYLNLRESNTQLAAENADLRRQIAKSYQVFDRRVFIVEDTIFRLQYEYVHARIIKNTINRRNNYLMINKGSNQGIREGMAVISPTGVVGIVRAVSNNFSSIMSLLHSDTRLSARIDRNSFSTGSISWDGRNVGFAQMLEIPPHIDVFVGDTIITSGFSLNFPEGIPIGIVREVQTRPTDLFHALNIELTTDFHTIDYVYVVRNLMRHELDYLLQYHSPN